jgi:hypothetical protein
MSNEPNKQRGSDPNTWPLVECEPADVFLGSFDHDCTPGLTDAQRAWPVVECESADVMVEGEQPIPTRPPSPSRS